MEEIWKPILGHSGYEASNLGRIRNLDRWVEYTQSNNSCLKRRLCKGQIKKQKYYPDKNPYKFFSLDRDVKTGKRLMLSVHRAVCLAFHGLPPDGKNYVAHLDGICTNNVPQNLAWTSQLENINHKNTHGTMLHGTSCYNAVINEVMVLDIFKKRSEGLRVGQIAKHLNIKRQVVGSVLLRRVWKHVLIPEDLIKKCAAFRK